MQTISVQALSSVAPQSDKRDSVARMQPGQVYAARFSDGWVKIGRGRDAQLRITCHIAASAMRGAKLVESCVSGQVVDSVAAESALIDMCGGAQAAVHGREWFLSPDYPALVAMIEGQYAGDPAEWFAAHSEAVEAQAQKVFNFIRSPVTPAPVFSDQDMAAWTSALEHAAVLEQIFLDDCYGGQLFSKESKGHSAFLLMAALALWKSPAHSVAVIYWKAFNEPDQLLSELSEAATQVCMNFAHTHDKAARVA
ncbi:hypothetical protein [Pseudomonas sichuanensis]|uniref:Uncharacterized protein n=1 Tax=Pseudomonas sichuanensis TaxID=2213015 RepID=A0ABV0DCW2_9PSED